jgi:protein involved in polysaccharide export with SLBB domain
MIVFRWAVLAAWLASGQTAFAQVPPEDPRSVDRASASALRPAAQREPVDENTYVVGPGDYFAVAVHLQGAELEHVPVTPEGDLVLPRIGAVPVAGKSLAEAKRAVTDALAESYRNVQIDVVLATVRTIQVHVTGQVVNPGTYSASALDVVSTLIDLAGGLTPNAGQRNIELHKPENTIRRVDLVRYRNAGDPEANPAVMDATSIRVPFEGEMVYCLGAVEQPGHYELVPGDDIQSLIEIAGGLVEGARRDSAEFREFVSDYDTRHAIICLDDLAVGERKLGPGDQVYIRYEHEGYRQVETVWITGEGIEHPGPFGISEGSVRLLDVIERAGGFTEDASFVEARMIRTTGVEKEDREFERLKVIPVQDMSKTEYQYFKAKSRERKGQVVVDFEALVAGDESQNLLLRREDRIFVPTTRTTVTVTGAVASPGLVTYLSERKASYYIERAGGYSSDAERGKTRVIKASTGEWEPARGAGYIVPGDEIWVPEQEDRDWWRLTRETVSFIASVAAIYLVFDQATR